MCPERVLPVSQLAGRYPQVLAELKRQWKRYGGNTRPLYEHLVLMKRIHGRETHYTEQERQICQTLEGAPLGMEQLALRLGTDVYHLDTSRLEREGDSAAERFLRPPTPWCCPATTGLRIIPGRRLKRPNMRRDSWPNPPGGTGKKSQGRFTVW